MKRGAAAAGGVGLGAALAWAWNGFIWVNGYGPEMTAEVAAALAVAFSRLLDRFEREPATGG